MQKLESMDVARKHIPWGAENPQEVFIAMHTSSAKKIGTFYM